MQAELEKLIKEVERAASSATELEARLLEEAGAPAEVTKAAVAGASTQRRQR